MNAWGRHFLFCFVAGAFAFAGCSSDPLESDASGDDPSETPGPWDSGISLSLDPQDSGDAEQGRYSLLHDGYMSCGIPYKLWENPLSADIVGNALGISPDAPTLEGREGKNAGLPYAINAFTTTDGVEVLNVNCLQCHGGFFNGEFVMGLGNASLDFTGSIEETGVADPIPDSILASFGLNEAEIAQFQKLTHRFAVIAPETQMRTVGHNPAEILAVRLMLHHDRDTLAWSDEPLSDSTLLDEDGNVLDETVMTSDPPPWWRAHKKNALFYNGMARGDHRGAMMLATSLCVDNLEEAAHVDVYFKNIHAYVQSLRAPKYPFPIDEELAAEGEPIFVQHCAGCHGTYSENEEEETYPNLLIPLALIGTDTVVANGGVIHAPKLVEWYNASFYGSITHFEPMDLASGVVGYVAPPLDGVWATAPFLHNGSVPTLGMLLNSQTRPAVWQRTDFDTRHFDQENLGWPYEALDYAQADAPKEEQKFIYDTSYWSQSNGGHTFGDVLDDTQRKALLEYIKTL